MALEHKNVRSGLLISALEVFDLVWFCYGLLDYFLRQVPPIFNFLLYNVDMLTDTKILESYQYALPQRHLYNRFLLVNFDLRKKDHCLDLTTDYDGRSKMKHTIQQFDYDYELTGERAL